MDFLAYADVGSVLHPRALGGQVMGRSILGIGHAIGQKWVMDPEQGAMLSRRFHHSKPPTILDIPAKMEWAALDIPDPETPVGSRGIGEPPVGGGCSAILNALAGCGRRRSFQARARECRYHSGVARSGPSHAASADGPYLMEM